MKPHSSKPEERKKCKMKAHEVVSRILKECSAMVKPGVLTIDIDNYASKMIIELGVENVMKGTSHADAKIPWPATTCINVNNVIAHGYPSINVLKEGDIVTIDLAIRANNVCADAALTVPVGQISRKRQRLLYYAKQTLYEAIKYMTPGRDTRDLANIIEMHAISRGYLVNRRFAGHRIGEQMHMKPNIYNTQEPSHRYALLQVGEVYCVEPMLTNGKDNIGIIDENGWECKTMDKGDSAVFEHMVEITANQAKILTTHFDYKQGELWS